MEQRFATQNAEELSDDAARKKAKKVRFVAGATTSGNQSFYEKNKVLIIAFVVVIFLVLGVLVAVLIAKKSKSQGTAGDMTGGYLEGGAIPFDGLTPPGTHGFHYGVDGGCPGGAGVGVGGAVGSGAGAPVPQFVGGGGPHSALPLRAWNESASVYVRR